MEIIYDIHDLFLIDLMTILPEPKLHIHSSVLSPRNTCTETCSDAVIS